MEIFLCDHVSYPEVRIKNWHISLYLIVYLLASLTCVIVLFVNQFLAQFTSYFLIACVKRYTNDCFVVKLEGWFYLFVTLSLSSMWQCPGIHWKHTIFVMAKSHSSTCSLNVNILTRKGSKDQDIWNIKRTDNFSRRSSKKDSKVHRAYRSSGRCLEVYIILSCKCNKIFCHTCWRVRPYKRRRTNPIELVDGICKSGNRMTTAYKLLLSRKISLSLLKAYLFCRELSTMLKYTRTSCISTQT